MVHSAIASPMIQYRGPFVLQQPEEAWFDVDMMQKDMLLAMELSRKLNVPVPTRHRRAHRRPQARSVDLVGNRSRTAGDGAPLPRRLVAISPAVRIVRYSRRVVFRGFRRVAERHLERVAEPLRAPGRGVLGRDRVSSDGAAEKWHP